MNSKYLHREYRISCTSLVSHKRSQTREDGRTERTDGWREAETETVVGEKERKIEKVGERDGYSVRETDSE